MVLTFIDAWLLTVTLDLWHLVLTIRLHGIFAWGFFVIFSWWDDERISWLIFGQSAFLFRFVYLLQLRYWNGLRLIDITLLIPDWNLAHERIRITGCTLAWNSWIICFLILNSARSLFLGSNWCITASRIWLSHLYKIIFFEIIMIVLIARYISSINTLFDLLSWCWTLYIDIAIKRRRRFSSIRLRNCWLALFSALTFNCQWLFVLINLTLILLLD